MIRPQMQISSRNSSHSPLSFGGKRVGFVVARCTENYKKKILLTKKSAETQNASIYRLSFGECTKIIVKLGFSLPGDYFVTVFVYGSSSGCS